MNKHLYCCQNTIQNFLDHIIPIPKDFNVKDSYLFGVGKQDFINGLRELTDIIKSVYADMIQSPAEYGLPLVKDIEYIPFNPKAADSKNSAHRLFVLLNMLVRNGKLSDSELFVDNKKFSESLKKLKSVYKVSNNKMIIQKLRDFGFIYDNNIFSYPDNHNVIHALYGYIQNVDIHHAAAFSLNYFFASHEEPSHQAVISEYLSGNEREFFSQLSEFMENEKYVVSNASDYRTFSFSIEYWIDSKDEKRIVRCHTDNGRLCVSLKLHNSDCYDYYIENLPENMKQIFRKKSSCRYCRESCNYRLYRTFEEISYTDCGYGNWFTIAGYDPNDVKYYEQIILLETKAVKTNARKKEIKVYIDE